MKSHRKATIMKHSLPEASKVKLDLLKYLDKKHHRWHDIPPLQEISFNILFCSLSIKFQPDTVNGNRTASPNPL